MIERINIATAQEQTFNLAYGDKTYKFSLSYNDFQAYWIMDITLNDLPVLTGIPMIEGINAFKGLEYIGVGSFYLIDTTPDSTIALDVKQDLGDRLALIRNA